MTRRSKLWLVAASLFTVINLVGAGVAAAGGDGGRLHTAVHVVLLVLGAYAVWRLALGTRRQQIPRAQEAAERLDHLQQSVDAIALEVERIGESQRFIAKLASERAETVPRQPHSS